MVDGLNEVSIEHLLHERRRELGLLDVGVVG